MGFFSKVPTLCAICGSDCSTAGGKKQLKDATVCWSCLIHAGYNPKDASKLSLSDVYPEASIRNKALTAIKEMPVSLQLQNMCIDTDGKRWYCKGGLLTGDGDVCAETIGVHSLSDLQVVWVESYTSSTTISKTENNGIKRAIIGGVLAGSTGAVIGAVTANHITTSEAHSNEHFYVHVRFKNEPKDYCIYLENSNEVNLLLRYFSQVPQEESTIHDSLDDLRKYKELLDDGIITQQDFEAKKKQLLGI